MDPMGKMFDDFCSCLPRTIRWNEVPPFGYNIYNNPSNKEVELVAFEPKLVAFWFCILYAHPPVPGVKTVVKAWLGDAGRASLRRCFCLGMTRSSSSMFSLGRDGPIWLLSIPLHLFQLCAWTCPWTCGWWTRVSLPTQSENCGSPTSSVHLPQQSDWEKQSDTSRLAPLRACWAGGSGKDLPSEWWPHRPWWASSWTVGCVTLRLLRLFPHPHGGELSKHSHDLSDLGNLRQENWFLDRRSCLLASGQE